MSTIKQNYASSATAFVITLASLANGGARESTKISNSALYLDAIVYVAFKLAAGSPASDKAINIYFYAGDGTNYTDNVTGANAAVTLRSPNNLFGPFVISAPDAGALTYKAFIPSIASFFGGVLPENWGIVVENRTGLAFDSTEGNHAYTYKGVYETVV